MSEVTTSSERMELDTGAPQGAPDTLPSPGAKGPRMGVTPVVASRDHPVPAVDEPLHVVPSDDGWLLRFEGDGQVAAVYPTKKEAMQGARDLARERGLRIVEHGEDGRIRA